MVVDYNDIINAIARAEDVALYNARARAIELSNGCKPSKEDDDKAIEIESWIQLLTRAAATIDETTCLDDDIIWQIIQNVNELNRDVDCDVSRTYSRNSSVSGNTQVPSGYVERVLGLYVDNTDPSNPIIRIYVNPLTISGDGTITSPFSAIGGGGGAVSSVNGLTGAVVLTTTNITEGSNLYFTTARVLATAITGFVAGAGTVAATDTILQAINKIVGNIALKGDVVGPASAVDNNIAVFDLTTGKLIKDGGATIASLLPVAAAANYRLTVSDGSGNRGNAGAITAARALKSDANGVPTHFDTATEPSLTELSYVKGVTSAIQAQLDAKASKTFVESISLQDGGTSIAATTYTIELYANYAYTINELKIISGAGTCTAALKINGTDVTSISAVAVSTTIATATSSGANTVAVGDKITLVTTSNSGLSNLQLTIKTTRI